MKFFLIGYQLPQLLQMCSIGCTVKEGSCEAIAALRERGIRTVMLSGDKAEVAGCVDRCLNLRELLGRQRSDSAWRTVERAKHYIGQHYADSELSVESVCTHLHLSPAYFSTLFKREEGMSFIAYVTNVRMERAAHLLLESDDKTYLIAEKTGYTDPNYFSYVFKRRFGISPSKYRAGGER